MTDSIRQTTTVVVKPVTVNAVVSQPSQVTAVKVNAGLPGRSGSGGGLQTEPMVAAIALSALRVVTLNDAGQLIYADHREPSHAFGALGILTSAVAAGEAIVVTLENLVTDSFWNWQPKAPIFLGINGLLTQAIPDTGFLLQVAQVISPTQIYFQLQEPILL